MLQARHEKRRDTPHNAVFPSRRGTWMSPHNMRRQWRQARADTDLAWVTPHTFRKTVATLIHDEADTRTAAAQLGHANEDVTAPYIARPAVAPDSSHILQRLGADSPTGEPGYRNQ
jgi:integrase